MADYSLSNAAEMIGRERREKEEIVIEVSDNCVVVNKVLKISCVIPGNVMILEDKFRSAYECKECKGKGEKSLKCLKCDGKGRVDTTLTVTEDCGRCDGQGFRVERCAACNGRGVLLEMPDEAKKRPTSGTIVGIGPDCKYYKLGDRVAYTNYSGNLIPFKGNNRLKIMTELEPFVLLQNIGNEVEAENIPEFVELDTPYQQ